MRGLVWRHPPCRAPSSEYVSKEHAEDASEEAKGPYGNPLLATTNAYLQVESTYGVDNIIGLYLQQQLGRNYVDLRVGTAERILGLIDLGSQSAGMLAFLNHRTGYHGAHTTMLPSPKQGPNKA